MAVGTKSAAGQVKPESVRWRTRRRRRRRRWRQHDCSATTRGDLDATVCDSTRASRSHPPSLVTDLNNPANRTCWISAPITPLTDDSTVNLTVNFGKKYEVRPPVGVPAQW